MSSKMQWSQRQQLMACLSLDEGLWRSLGSWRFRARTAALEDSGFWFWVDCLHEFWEQWGTLPDLETLKSIGAQKFGGMPEEVHPYIDQDSAQAFILAAAWKQSVDPKKIQEQGLRMLTLFIKERLASKAGSDLSAGTLSADEILRDVRAAYAQADAMGADKFASHFPGGDFEVQPEDAFQAVGIDFVDQLCGGGLLKGEVVGHAAPIGQGKTTLILQLVWARAYEVYRAASARCAKAGGTDADIDWGSLPWVYLFAYEKVGTLLANFVSNAANIPRETALTAMLKGKRGAKLSTSVDRNYRDYELSMFGDQIKEAEALLASGGSPQFPAGELERFDKVVKLTDRLIRIVDFSGHDESLQEWSTERVEGIERYLHAHQESIGRPGVNFVAIDFVGAMIDTALAAGRFKQDAMTQQIKMVPNDLSRRIGAVFGCPVWAAHQLNPDENDKRGGAIPNPTAASGSRMFLEYCAIGFASGKLTKENVAAYVLGKQRRLQTSEADVLLGKLQKQFARWSTANDYVVREGVIMPRSEVRTNLIPNAIAGRITSSGSWGGMDVG
jgi:hypothetical protein